MITKYMGDSGIYFTKHRNGDSPPWSDILHTRDIYLRVRKMSVGNGCITSLWGDAWCGHSPLKDKFPDLYNICNEQLITVGAAKKIWV
jgi:hypothetical protein